MHFFIRNPLATYCDGVMDGSSVAIDSGDKPWEAGYSILGNLGHYKGDSFHNLRHPGTIYEGGLNNYYF
jgi:hypothetical protein